jgi:hypothetical protein
MLSTTRTLVTVVLAAVAAAGAGVAVAQPGYTPRAPVPFHVLDGDADGFVSTQEFENHRAQQQAARRAQGRLLRNSGQAPNFSAWDQDGDGRLTPTELAAGQQARMQQRWARPVSSAANWRRPCWRYR